MVETSHRQQTGLPAELSSFIGRRHELAEVRRALTLSRLVTLTGPGGVGKTRLAVRVAADVTERYPDGVRMVELAPVLDPELVADTVVAGLGLSSATTGAPLDVLVAHLRERAVLLVLDNCEHVRPAVRLLISRLLEDCPRVGILATSRHGLEVPGERLFPVPSLSVPPRGRELRSSEALLVYDAARLLSERAVSVWPAFEISDENRAAVAELVRRLDGVPLAIELAAIRLRTLSAGQVLERLRDRFSLLTGGDRAAAPRQQSLLALLDWSYDLLGPDEQQVWECASVFVGSFDVTDLSAVLADDGPVPERLHGLLEGLVDKSLMQSEQTSVGVRFRQLESVMEYGLRTLADTTDVEELRDRHLEHYRDEALTAARQMFGRSGITWFRRLSAGHDNFRAALERCAVDDRLAETGAEVVAALQHYWVMTGRFAEGRHWAGRLGAVLPPGAPGRVPLLVVAGRLAVLQGDVEEGRALLSEGLAGTVLPDDATWRAHALHGLALAALFWDEPGSARTLLENALALHRSGDDPMGVPLALIQLATLHAALGESREAASYAEECLSLSASSGEQWCAAMALWTQALAAWRERDVARVRSHARKVLALKEPFGDRLGMAMCVEVLAWCAAVDGAHEVTARLLGAVRSALDSVGGGLFRTLQLSHDECVASTRAALGDAAYERLCSEGSALVFEEAVALAVGRTAHRRRGGPARAGAVASVPRLTRREAEVARLVAEGLTDREIGQRLVLATRTAEGHVQRALRKLGFTSRQQLAGWVEQQATS